ncbi:MAG: alpha/beta hydrolase [Pseudomonadota bacterium]
MKRGYTEGTRGQLHWHEAGSEGPERFSALVCLHPSPYSGLAFARLAPELNAGRRVLAPDYPGYGGSDSCGYQPSIGEFADAMLEVVNDRCEGPVDLLGFHTGCLVAAEMSLLASEHVRSLTLIDSPAFDAETRRAYLAKMGAPFELEDELSSLQAAWEFNVAGKAERIGLDRGFELFVEQARAARGMNAAFHAAFSYDVETRLAAVSRPTLIVATQSSLLETTRRTAELIPGAHLVERLEITRDVLDGDVSTIAQTFIDHYPDA